MKDYVVLRLPSDVLERIAKGAQVLLVYQNNIHAAGEAVPLIKFPRPGTEDGIAEAWEAE